MGQFWKYFNRQKKCIYLNLVFFSILTICQLNVSKILLTKTITVRHDDTNYGLEKWVGLRQGKNLIFHICSFNDQLKLFWNKNCLKCGRSSFQKLLARKMHCNHVGFPKSAKTLSIKVVHKSRSAPIQIYSYA